MICSSVVVGTLPDALILEFIVGSLSLRELLVLLECDFLVDAIVVCAVVSYIEFTEAIDEGKVAIAIESSGMPCAESDKVSMIDILNGSCGISEDGGGVGIDRCGARGSVASGEDSIMYDDARGVEFVPYCRIRILVFESVEVVVEDIFAGRISVSVDGHVL